MKCLSLSLCLLILFSSVQAQQKKDFYYFGNKKVFVGQNTEKLYVRMKEGTASTKRMALKRDFQIPENAYATLQRDNFLVINLKGLDKNKQLQIVSDLKKSGNNIEISRPVLIAPDGKEVVIDEDFYVKLKPGISLQKLKDFVIQKRCIINETPYKYDDKVFLLKAGFANNFDGLKLANVFFESGLFEYSEPDFRMLDVMNSSTNDITNSGKKSSSPIDLNLRNKQSSPPNDPLFDLQWAAKNTGTYDQGNGTIGADISLLDAWDITKGNPLIKIAVIDEGVDRLHPDLVNNISPIGFGFGAANANTGDILDSLRSHGTSCAGIIAAEANNGIGIAGIAPLCKIIPVNVTVNTFGNYGTSLQLAQAIDWAWSVGEADVLSNSWGGGTASSLIRDAIHRAVTQGRGGKGSVVVFSSGNYDAGVSFPAIFPETIAVGAMSMCYQRKSTVSCDGEYLWGSNYGAGLDIAAPGVKIVTTKIANTSYNPNPDYTFDFNGTSSAAPMVSGVAALILSVNNNLTQFQVREILERTARKVGKYSYNFMQDEPNGSWSSELGHGMVNAKDALLAAQNPVFCPIKVSAPGPLQICTSGSVVMEVVNPIAGDQYIWTNEEGTVVKTGSNYNANKTGSYRAIRITTDACRDTSYTIQVTVSAAEGTLIADAGKDTTLFLDSKIFLGGGPSGSGGTGIINPMRGMVNDFTNNMFIKFDLTRLYSNYRIVKEDFNVDVDHRKYYSGAAATPYGLYMIDTWGSFAKIDTATGNAYQVSPSASGVYINGMTYDPTTGKIFAIGDGTYNDLYEVDPKTGILNFITHVDKVYSFGTIISLSADTSGQLFGLEFRGNGAANMIKIDKTTGERSLLGYPGFDAYNPQGGDVDPLTDELYQVFTSSPTDNYVFGGSGMWKISKTTGVATLVGSVAEHSLRMDALAFGNKEYKYHWSPATNLSNPNDANPQFIPTAPGKFEYTLTVTDLCGNTATDKIIVNVQNAMPVTLLSFKGKMKDDAVALAWVVQNEVNFDRYRVERSTDGSSFTAIGSVQGRQSIREANYNFDDQNLPASATLYYRLKMIDKDGKVELSNVILIRNDVNLINGLIVIKPNPFTSSLTIQYESVASGKLKGQMINSRGETVRQFTFRITQGTNEIQIQGDNLPAGIYLLKLNIGDKVITRKIVKQ